MQPLLSSSYQGWGIASLDQDADELLLLLQHLKSARGSQVTDVAALDDVFRPACRVLNHAVTVMFGL